MSPVATHALLTPGRLKKPAFLAGLSLAGAFAACWSLWQGVPGMAAIEAGIAIATACYLAGPLLGYELRRLARHGHFSVLCCAYGLILLLAFVWLYLTYFPAATSRNELFAENMTLRKARFKEFAVDVSSLLAAIPGLAALVLGPIYLADVIAHERWRRTFDLLLTTPLEDHEIVLGRLMARVSYLMLGFLGGMPALFLLGEWMGANLWVVASAWIATVLLLMSIGSLSVLCSTLNKNPLSALMLAFLCIALGIGLSHLTRIPHLGTPMGFVHELQERLATPSRRATPASIICPLLGQYAFVHVSVAGLCCLVASRCVRQEESGIDPSPVRRDWIPMPAQELPQAGSTDAKSCEPARAVQRVDLEKLRIETRRVTQGFFERPTQKVIGQALLWKEASHLSPVPFLPRGEGARPWFVFSMLVCFAVPVWGTYLYDPAAYGFEVHGLLNPLLRGAGMLLAVVLCCAIGFRAAASISREHDQRTLTSLLLLPIDRREILHAKWLGSILRYRHGCYLLMFAWLIGMMAGALHPLAVALLLVSSITYVVFIASTGLWLSALAPNTAIARLSMGVVLLLLFACTATAAAFAGPKLDFDGVDSVLFHTVTTAFNPIGSWWFAGFSGWDIESLLDPDREGPARLQAMLIGNGILLVVSMALWTMTVRQFHKRAGRGSFLPA